MIIPRPCAFLSKNYTQASTEYYRGQNTKEISMSYLMDENESNAELFDLAARDVPIFYQNGTSADDLAFYNSETYEFEIQTDDDDKVGV